MLETASSTVLSVVSAQRFLQLPWAADIHSFDQQKGLAQIVSHQSPPSQQKVSGLRCVITFGAKLRFGLCGGSEISRVLERHSHNTGPLCFGRNTEASRRTETEVILPSLLAKLSQKTPTSSVPAVVDP